MPEVVADAQSTALALQAPSLPPMLAAQEGRAEEWDALSERDRRVLTPEVAQRWGATLHPDDYTLLDLAQAEHRRRAGLATLRHADLTNLEMRLLRYLKRHDGQIMSYLEIAKHLFTTPTRSITRRTLAARHGFASPEIAQIWVLTSNLRRKLEVDPRRPQHLATYRGSGYAWFDVPPSLHDGVDYVTLQRHHQRVREQMRHDLGLIEGEYAVMQHGDGTSDVVVRPDADDEPAQAPNERNRVLMGPSPETEQED